MVDPEYIARALEESNYARNYGCVIDLSDADLSGRDLTQARLYMMNLRRANLSGANLCGMNLSRHFDYPYSDGEYPNFSEANLSGAHLREARICGTNLTGANLSGADLCQADLSGTNLTGANLTAANVAQANLTLADLTGADLHGANLSEANLSQTKLSMADIRRADLSGANLKGTNFSGADLSGANLCEATLIRTNLEKATLTGAHVFGISAWDVQLYGAIQTNLVITPVDQPEISVDNVEVAQFIYLLLNKARIRDVIETITSKAVLILGRFTPARKATLDALRVALRGRNYLPILFDFEKPTGRDFTETVSTLAHLARFVIADLTDPRSIPQELTAIVPRLLSVPVRPLLRGSQKEWAMFSDLGRYPQVIAPFHYTDDQMLVACLETDVIAPAERKARELAT